MALKPQFEEHSIVVVGDLAPKMFHPIWFARNGLLRDAEADEAELEFVHKEIAVWSTAWLSFQAQPKRIQISTKQAPYFEVLRDLALGILATLPHLPVEAVGLNWEAAYSLPSEELWHKFGHTLAPKEPWGDSLDRPGMLEVRVHGRRRDDYKGFVGVSVSPDPRKGLTNGVRIYVNDHREVKIAKDEKGTDIATSILTESWDQSRKQSAAISDALLKTVEQ